MTTIHANIQDIIRTNVPTKVHEEIKSQPPGSHAFKQTRTILELIQDIAKTNILIKNHEDWTINVTYLVLTRKNDPLSGDHVFQPTGTIFEPIQDIIGTNLLTKFHGDWTIKVASSVNKANVNTAQCTTDKRR
ncbi:hypothetical protein DPMN_082963 [Dreissena polymorpha]|uniref:Uncharacterized protein n=1 Tax=Dreissena polymorpha TaxID=45954 RepID=A0A9D3Y7V1_DREPO|nr:hypothetical protein DPMN_082963 [Dreissena polymorpha]